MPTKRQRASGGRKKMKKQYFPSMLLSWGIRFARSDTASAWAKKQNNPSEVALGDQQRLAKLLAWKKNKKKYVMTLGFAILTLGVLSIIGLDLLGYNKVWGAFFTMLALGLYNPSGLSDALYESLPMAAFLLGVMSLANYLQESGALVAIGKKINNKWKLGGFIFVTSVFFDNTVATNLGIGIASAREKSRAHFAAFAAMMALLGGLASCIGDITSTMTWSAGVMTVTGLLSMMPAVIVGAIYYIWSCKKMELEFNSPQAISGRNSWMKLIIGMILFIMIPVLKLLHITIGSFELTQPGVTALLVAFAGWIIIHFAFGEKQVKLTPHSKEEKKSMLKTIFYILFILACIGFLHDDLEGVRSQVKYLGIGILIILSIIISSHVDNVPWTAVLISVLTYPTDSIEWKLLVIALGLAGGLSPVGSTSTLVASSVLKVGFKEFYTQAPKIVVTIIIVMTIVYLQSLI